MTGEVPMKIRKALSKQDRVTVRMTQKQLTWVQTVMMAKVVAPISTMQQAMQNTEWLLFNSLLALVYLLVFFYCTQLINELRDRVKDDRWLWSNRLQNSFDRLQEYLIIRVLIVSIGLAVLWVLMSFIDKSYLAVDNASIWLTIFLLWTLVLWALAKDIALCLIVLAKSGRGVSLNISVAWYVPAIISVILNRLFALTPNVLFGSVIKVKSDTLEDALVNSPAHRTWSLVLVMVVAIFLRLVSDGFDWWWYIFCIGLAYGLCVDVFWALTRVDAFWWPDVYRYNKWIRFVLYFTVLFAFLHLVFNPAGDFDQVQTALNNDFWSMIWVLVWCMAVSWLFRLYAYYIHPLIYKKVA
jgi:hypothetical protein